MDNQKQVKETGAPYSAWVADLSRPVIVERDGRPVAALVSIEEYERYQAWLREQQWLSASEARRAADRAMFGDLVGCALASGDPLWVSAPEPHWRIPYRSFDGTVLIAVDVDARTGAVALTDEERTALMDKVEQLAAAGNVTA